MGQPAWWRDAVFYQIYPRSFQDGDGDGVGDLRGIAARLDYLRGRPDSLGVDAIWLCPFYPSPLADFGYDVADFTAVDPQLGTLDDLRMLIAEAHRRAIRVIIDWVPNHTSDCHPWFVDARSSAASPFRDWYVWRPSAPGGGPPNNWMADFSEVGPAWSFDDRTGEWYLHSFTPRQPDLNWDNAAVRAAMLDTLRFWLDLGVDGFRIDVVNKIGKDPALADNSVPLIGPGVDPGGRRHDEDWPSTFARLADIRRTVQAYGERMTVGEVYVMALERLARYVGPSRLDLAHNFVFMNLPWRARGFRSTVDRTMQLFGRRWPAWCLGNHDHSRIQSRYAADGDGEARARSAALLLLTLRGTPFIYQGEELGLPDLDLPEHQYLDVAGRDRYRAPQPWAPPSSAGPGAGFTTATPWLPMTPDAESRNVQSQLESSDSILQLYRDLLALRRELVALRRGSYRSLDLGPQLFGFVRAYGRQRLLVVVNFGQRPAKFRCSSAGLHGPADIVASSRHGAMHKRLDLCGVRIDQDEAVLVRLP